MVDDICHRRDGRESGYVRRAEADGLLARPLESRCDEPSDESALPPIALFSYSRRGGGAVTDSTPSQLPATRKRRGRRPPI